ncbi:ribosomal protein S12 methylthiotransferase accessory factor [Streptomyces pini]|uniref:Ribosomal protein S12 methylthiotransferase accessory factor n=1 Tax=Streptomyces pini TaxID=1520580 RepID=A0A1I4GUH8_9ACTN|nr:TOMM precursor leader peptide-binding protein [Streptomyces pini]SFL33103.1 ribosomal protein S12 methylthiotransferase accessory factor [Streptomyces pini]
MAFAPWLDGLLCGLAADIAAAQSLPRGQRGVDLTRAVATVGLRDPAVGGHPLVPDPLCPDCGRPPRDSPERARVTLRAVPDRGGLHARTLPRVRRAPLSTVVDPVVGVVAEIRTAAEGGPASATAPFGGRAGTGPEAGYGRAADTETAQTIAVLEALERLGGMVPGGRCSTVRASRDDLGPVAVDPRGFGTHDPHCYARPDFPFTPWDGGHETTWVWAHHMSTGRQVLVPESPAYYRSRALRPDDPGFVHDTSSGCAVGSCIRRPSCSACWRWPSWTRS